MSVKAMLRQRIDRRPTQRLPNPALSPTMRIDKVFSSCKMEEAVIVYVRNAGLTALGSHEPFCP